MDFAHKRVTDPVHGTIALSKLEADVSSSRAFQRLHNVRQLGLAHLVFPGANYSRFSHSLGALHNASLMLEAIGRLSGPICPDHCQAVRLAALLHDIGHYPFSHATEHVMADYYANKSLLVSKGDDAETAGPSPVQASGAPEPVYYDHEALGAQIVERDDELQDIFKKNSFDLDLLKGLFQPGPINHLLPIISSDLDCDRLDYLRRTAHFSGAPYGSVDIRFIAGSAMLDSAQQFCFSYKAMRAADHLLVSRYYDYVQVPYHKTVSALEWSLVSGLTACLEANKISGAAADLVDMIRDGRWSSFDDQQVVGKFRELRAASSDDVLNDHLDGIINRRPPKLVIGWEEVGPEARSNATRHSTAANAALDEVAKQVGLDRRRLHVWEAKTKLSSTQAGDELTEASAKAVRILDPSTGKARPLVSHPDSLMHTLSRSEYAGVRVYFLPAPSDDIVKLRSSLREAFEKRVGSPTI